MTGTVIHSRYAALDLAHSQTNRRTPHKIYSGAKCERLLATTLD